MNRLQILRGQCWNNRMFTSIIKDLLGAKVAECNEISQPLIYDDYGSNKIAFQKEEQYVKSKT